MTIIILIKEKKFYVLSTWINFVDWREKHAKISHYVVDPITKLKKNAKNALFSNEK